ncbi:MAG: hypothetical protein ACI4WH_05550 [Oscillospiraceae bacterium]
MKEWQKRALRTFFQAFSGVIAMQLLAYQGQELTKTVVISLVASAVASGISAVMNLNE